MLSQIGKLSQFLGLGQTPKDAGTNLASMLGGVSGLVLLINQYYPLGPDLVKIATLAGAIAVYLTAQATGKNADLKNAQRPREDV